jgi:thioesterase domain-containing protein
VRQWSEELEHFLHEQIPLARAMGVRVVQADPEEVVLSAPLAANTNHHGTLFGGSASALAILCAWSWLHIRLADEDLDPDVVIQRSDMEFLRPGRTEVTARCPGSTARAWKRFLQTYRRFGKARIEVTAYVSAGGETAASLNGLFVALEPEAHGPGQDPAPHPDRPPTDRG